MGAYFLWWGLVGPTGVLGRARAFWVVVDAESRAGVPASTTISKVRGESGVCVPFRSLFPPISQPTNVTRFSASPPSPHFHRPPLIFTALPSFSPPSPHLTLSLPIFPSLFPSYPLSSPISSHRTLSPPIFPSLFPSYPLSAHLPLSLPILPSLPRSYPLSPHLTLSLPIFPSLFARG
ncbi:unnamed protein product [Closterium sp. Naga37s-1]|nr:unnamed protein product [Closterium sp. Naga37s-1]